MSFKWLDVAKRIQSIAQAGSETSDAGFFKINELPSLSLARITESQIKQMFNFLKNPDLSTICD